MVLADVAFGSFGTSSAFRCVMWQLDVSPDSEGCATARAWKAWPVQMAWEDGAGAVIKSIRVWNRSHLFSTCLRNSNSLIFNDLAWMANKLFGPG